MKLKLTYNKSVGKTEGINILTNEIPKFNVTKEQIKKVKKILEEGCEISD